jgi:hypothetical protein
MAAPFDARRLALTGAAVPVIEVVMQSTITGAAQYSVSRQERLSIFREAFPTARAGWFW